jgi:hypothetical protein
MVASKRYVQRVSCDTENIAQELLPELWNKDGRREDVVMARYIDADKLYDAVEGVYKYAKGGERIAAKVFIAMICDEPTASVVEMRHGEWIGKPIAGMCTVRCSACGMAFSENSGRWLYCPNCGAKMDGGSK